MVCFGNYLKFLNKVSTRKYIFNSYSQVIFLRDNILFKSYNCGKLQHSQLKTINEVKTLNEEVTKVARGREIEEQEETSIAEQQESHMESLLAYLQFVKKSLENVHNHEYIHFVLGNESCDLDSSVSATVFAYFLHMHRDSKIPKDALIVPIQNVSEENFLIRTENCYLYKEIGLPLDMLVYRDHINFEELVKSKKVTTSLVDQNILPEDYKELKETVVQIFDHRPKDVGFNWDENKVEVNINQVGSCVTLIADKILSLAENILFKDLAYIIFATIIFDTQGLSDETKRAKQLDRDVVATLTKKFNFNVSIKETYETIWKVHNDVSKLTPKQILMKDMKIVECIPVPGLPMLVEDFVKLQGCCESLKKFAEEHSAPVLVLIGLDTSDEVKRDVAIFYTIDGECLRDRLINKLCSCQKSKGYDFNFTEVETSIENIKCFRQKNVTLSRKQIIPVIIDAVKLQ